MKSTDVYKKLLEQIAGAIQPLPDKPEESPESTLSALWLLAQGTAWSARMALKKELGTLHPSQLRSLQDLVRRRLDGEPLSHIVERQHFMGLEMLAGPRALVPRVETELLGGAALDIARTLDSDGGSLKILDICTGSGNVALALAHHLPDTLVWGADLSQDAVSLARENAAHLGLSNRVRFEAGDLLQPFRDDEWLGKVDLITCNPPYISSAKASGMAAEIANFEPSLAFDGGPFGVSILLRLLQDAPQFLRPGGWLVFEVGLGQGPAIEKRLKVNGFFDVVRTHIDSANNIRALSTRRASVEILN